MWAPGSKIGRYQLVDKIGKGGMAETWLGELMGAEGMRKPVVLKRVLPGLSDNQEFIEAFVREAKITASLSHGNVAQVFDFGQLAGSHFMAIEFVDGYSLDRVLKRGIKQGYWHMPYPVVVLIALEVAKGLEHVHTRRGPGGPLNIVHRDISPDNIIVGLDGTAKLVDFGIAKSFTAGGNQTEAGVVKGKYIYFSPEQARAEKVDFRTDIYALGVVLYRLVTGKKAFDGQNFKVLKQIENGEYVHIEVANPDVPDSLRAVITKMMATAKEDRYASTLDLIEALQACRAAIAPRAGTHWVRDWMRWLYQDELQKRGEALDLRSGSDELISSWRPQAKAIAHTGEIPASSAGANTAHSRSRPRTVDPPTAEPSKPPRLIGLVVGAALLGLLAVVAVFALQQDEPVAGARGVMQPPARPAGPPVVLRPAPGEEIAQDGEGVEPPPNNPPPDEGAQPPKTDPPKTEPPKTEPPKTEPVAQAVEKSVSYDAEAGPVSIVLTESHAVSLDGVPPMPAASGAITHAEPLPSGLNSSGRVIWNMGELPRTVGATEHAVPAALFTPGSSPSLEILTSAGRWSHRDARLAMFVSTAGEAPEQLIPALANDTPVLGRGSLIIVDATDRFSIRDLSAGNWKVTVKPQPRPGHVVPPVLLFARGDKVQVDGRVALGGYAVLSPGAHRLTGAKSAWLTLPTLKGLKLANVEVSFTR